MLAHFPTSLWGLHFLVFSKAIGASGNNTSVAALGMHSLTWQIIYVLLLIFLKDFFSNKSRNYMFYENRSLPCLPLRPRWPKESKISIKKTNAGGAGASAALQINRDYSGFQLRLVKPKSNQSFISKTTHPISNRNNTKTKVFARLLSTLNWKPLFWTTQLSTAGHTVHFIFTSSYTFRFTYLELYFSE